MDFGKLLDDVQSLRIQFESASKEQNGAWLALQNTLEQHYAELGRQVEALQSMQQEAARQLAAEQSGRIDAIRQEQGERIDAVRQEQGAFLQEQGERTETIRRSHEELRAEIEGAAKSAREVTGRFAAQEEKLAQMKHTAEADMRALDNQTADGIGKVNAKLAELQTALARQDQTKPVEELQKKLETLKNETGAAINNLGGQLEKTRALVEQLKESQRTLGRSREETERLSRSVEELEGGLKTLRAKLRDLSTGTTGGGAPIGSGGGSRGNDTINWVALGLGLVAILGLCIGGFFLNRSQTAQKQDLQQQIVNLQATNAAELQALNDQFSKLSDIVNTTPSPTPAPTPTPSPAPTPTPSPAADATPAQ